ncbi:MAG: rhomboid family intramembrane serine protease [Chlamydiae bacterium]|nr:rhomboid family intramembrane serine protease [Chlamydiota bacterium]
MRQIASFKDEQPARAFQAALEHAGIECLSEVSKDKSGQGSHYDIWVIKEEDLEESRKLYEAFQKEPQAFSLQDSLASPRVEVKPLYEESEVIARERPKFPVTRFIILLCIVVFFWGAYELQSLRKTSPALVSYFGMTPFSMKLLYDDPPVFEDLYAFFLAHPDLKVEEMKKWDPAVLQQFQAINEKPLWRGFYVKLLQWPQKSSQQETPWFVKISQGEFWRLWTPCILHGNFLHILFNMLWLWLLGRQVEFKLGAGKYLVGAIAMGIVSNTAQYLMSGALFLGYSGIVCGLGGFIWVRQKKAPWEGYGVPKATLLFLLIFILGMALFQVGAFFVMRYYSGGTLSLGGIGNTSHIVGWLSGMVLARIPAFYRVKV